MKIAVVGARGQLAAAVVHECEPHHEIAAFTHEQLDVADDAAVAAAMDRTRPDAIVNGVAFNDVDGAEDRPMAALNGLGRASSRYGSVAAPSNTKSLPY